MHWKRCRCKAPGLLCHQSSQDGILHGAQAGTTHASNHGPGRWLVKPLSHKRAARRSTAAARVGAHYSPLCRSVRSLRPAWPLPPLSKSIGVCLRRADAHPLSLPTPLEPKTAPGYLPRAAPHSVCFSFPGPRLAGAPVRCPLLCAPLLLRSHGPSWLLAPLSPASNNRQRIDCPRLTTTGPFPASDSCLRVHGNKASLKAGFSSRGLSQSSRPASHSGLRAPALRRSLNSSLILQPMTWIGLLSALTPSSQSASEALVN